MGARRRKILYRAKQADYDVKKMITLEKQFTRYEWPLFWCSIWDYGDRIGIREWLGVGVDNMLFLRSGDKDAVTVWYDKSEYNPEGEDKFDRAVISRIESDPAWVDLLITRFESGWDQLFPYLAEGKKIANGKELGDYCDLWQWWWTSMSLVFVVPNVSGLSETVCNKLLLLRAKTQEYSEEGGGIIAQYLGRQDAALADAWPFMSAKEVLWAGQRSVSEAWVANILERRQGVGLLNGSLYLECDLEMELKRRSIRLVHKQAGNSEVIEGTAVSPGLVRGVVKVVTSYDEVDLVGVGEILVTEMTMPSFGPAMKKAVAIVTDEGGITCHAAIVAREMNKPCIIGTKIATQVLKDGDMVEVDADRGVVRVLR